MGNPTPCAHCGETAFIYKKDGSCWNKICSGRGEVSAPKVIDVSELGAFFDVENPHFEETSDV